MWGMSTPEAQGGTVRRRDVPEHAGYLVVHFGQAITHGVSMATWFGLGGLCGGCQCGGDRSGRERVCVWGGEVGVGSQAGMIISLLMVIVALIFSLPSTESM